MRIIKIGGSLLDDPSRLGRLILGVAARKNERIILVHGGGPQASRLCDELGIESVMRHGRRITDRQTLDLVTMVYAGLNNKWLIALMQESGCNAIGLSGVDARLLTTTKRPVVDGIDYGYVGDLAVSGVNVPQLSSLLDAGLVPVLNPITYDGEGGLLNTNADTIASVVAAAFCDAGEPVELDLILDRPGLLADPDDPTSVIASITAAEVKERMAGSSIRDGMLPKISNALYAYDAGVRPVRIGDVDLLEESGAGTVIA